MLIPTSVGDFKLTAPPVEEFISLRAALPFGIVGLKSTDGGVIHGIVMKCDEHELHAIKRQPVEMSAKAAHLQLQTDFVLILKTLAAYIKEGFGGVLIPCAYQRDKAERGVESGIALFVYPDPEGIEVQDQSWGAAYDRSFGRGATTMLVRFFNLFTEIARDTGLPLHPAIGLDVRVRSQLGQLTFGFLVSGKKLFYLGNNTESENASWMILGEAGIMEAYHLHSIAFEISSSDLKLAKGEPMIPDGSDHEENSLEQ